jgi:hypothetical protein
MNVLESFRSILQLYIHFVTRKAEDNRNPLRRPSAAAHQFSWEEEKFAEFIMFVGKGS